jgi:hypothetical protein
MPHSDAALSPHVPQFSAEIQTRGVLIGLPCYGGMMSAATYHGLRETEAAFRDAGIPWNVMTITNESLVQRARNGIAAEFLASQCDRLIFIDVDIGFTGQQVLRLLTHDRDIVGGLYRKKSLDRVEFAVNWLPNAAGQARRDPATGALECAAVGTGFMAIKREVFEAMAQAFPQIHYAISPGDGRPGAWRDHCHAFFDCWIDPATRGYLSEDYAFCARWRAMGGEVWCDPGLILQHHGNLPLSADPMEHLGQAAA